MKYFIRGLFDTDGSLTLWKTNNRLYPRIYFSSISKILVRQVRTFLKKEGFKVTYWQTQYQNNNWNISYRLSINGIKMLIKWIKEIGFSNPKHMKKVEMLGIKPKFYK